MYVFTFSELLALAVCPTVSAIVSKDVGIKKCILITLQKASDMKEQLSRFVELCSQSVSNKLQP